MYREKIKPIEDWFLMDLDPPICTREELYGEISDDFNQTLQNEYLESCQQSFVTKAKLNEVGYWEIEDGENRKQEVLQYQDIEWAKTEEAAACIAYMQNSHVPEPKASFQWMGYANCRVCGELLGTTDRTDENELYLFPEKWEHYIKEHAVKPPNSQFIIDAVNWYKEFKNRPEDKQICVMCGSEFIRDFEHTYVCSKECKNDFFMASRLVSSSKGWGWPVFYCTQMLGLRGKKEGLEILEKYGSSLHPHITNRIHYVLDNYKTCIEMDIILEMLIYNDLVNLDQDNRNVNAEELALTNLANFVYAATDIKGYLSKHSLFGFPHDDYFLYGYEISNETKIELFKFVLAHYDKIKELKDTYLVFDDSLKSKLEYFLIK